MKNKYFNYDNINVWSQEYWAGRFAPVDDLVRWVSDKDPLVETPYEPPEGAYAPIPSDANGFTGYVDPEELAYWDALGVKMEIHHIWVAKWISLVPKEAKRNSGVNYPMVLSVHQEHVWPVCDPFWPMRTIRQCRDFAREVVADGSILLITVTEGPDVTRQYSNIIMEACSLYPIDYTHIRFNVTPIYRAGNRLADMPGFLPCDEEGTPMENPDDQTETLGVYKLLDISRTWKSMGSPNFGQLIGLEGQSSSNATYDSERFIHTAMAQRLVEPLMLERTFMSCDDPQLQKFWEKHGVKFEAHDSNHERWFGMVPLCVYDQPEEKLPVMLIFQEVYYCNDHLPIEAASYWYEYCRLAMQGECILVFYACERMDHNEYMAQVYREAAKLYPIDRTRVYITGYSHNSGTATQFAFNHPDIITAVAGGAPGMLMPGMPQEERQKKIMEQREIDMPCIMVMGMNEHSMPNEELTYENSGFLKEIRMNALKAYPCQPRTEEDFKAAFRSEDTATRKVGVPGDKSEVLFLEGVEHYIVDVKNTDGNYHLRFVAIENMPHNPFPSLQMMEWSFVRRFERNPQTMVIIERY